jgi:hypothetical protein
MSKDPPRRNTIPFGTQVSKRVAPVDAELPAARAAVRRVASTAPTPRPQQYAMVPAGAAGAASDEISVDDPQHVWDELVAHLAWLPHDRRPDIRRILLNKEYLRVRALLREEQERYPRNVSIGRAIKVVERATIRHFLRRLAPTDRVPVLTRAVPGSRTKDHRAAIAARIDGRATLDDVIRDSGLSRLDALLALETLIGQGAVVLKTELRRPPKADPVRLAELAEKLGLSQDLLDDAVGRETMPDPGEVEARAALLRNEPAPATHRPEAGRHAAQTARPPPMLGFEQFAPAGGDDRAEPDDLPNVTAPATKLEPDLALWLEEPPPTIGAAPPSAAPAPAAKRGDSAAGRYAVTVPARVEIPPVSAEPSLREERPQARPVERAPIERAGPPPWLEDEPNERDRTRSLRRVVIALSVLTVLALGISVIAVSAAMKDPATEDRSAPASGAASASKPAPPPEERPAESAAPLLSAPGTIRVHVEVSPREARVYVDGVRIKPPLEYSLTRDDARHEVRVEAPGYKPKKTAFAAAADVHLVISLEPLPPKPPPSASAEPEEIY